MCNNICNTELITDHNPMPDPKELLHSIRSKEVIMAPFDQHSFPYGATRERKGVLFDRFCRAILYCTSTSFVDSKIHVDIFGFAVGIVSSVYHEGGKIIEENGRVIDLTPSKMYFTVDFIEI